MISIGLKIKNIRMGLGLRVEFLSRELGVSRSYLTLIENRERSLPKRLVRKILLDTNGYTKLLLGGKAVLEELGSGEIKYKLMRSGNPLPINDVWIAPCAIEMGAVIITYDKHFLKIKEARVWNTH